MVEGWVVTLTSAHVQLLNEALNEVLNNCVYNEMFFYIKSLGVKFNDVKIDPSITPGSAGYNPFSGILVFYSTEQITSNFLSAELVHLFQDAYHTNSYMQNYYYTARVNIEFEAQLLMDISCLIRALNQGYGGCGYFGQGVQYKESYGAWIESLVSDGTPFGIKFPSILDILTQLAVFSPYNSLKKPKIDWDENFILLIIRQIQNLGFLKVVCSPRIISYKLEMLFFCCIFAASKLYRYVYKENR